MPKKPFTVVECERWFEVQENGSCVAVFEWSNNGWPDKDQSKARAVACARWQSQVRMKDDRDAELASLRFQLANLRAEAARVVGAAREYVDASDSLYTFNPLPAPPMGQVMQMKIPSDESIRHTKARADLKIILASLPSPAVVAVPEEPGEGDIEAMARAILGQEHLNDWSAEARAAYRALVKRHGG